MRVRCGVLILALGALFPHGASAQFWYMAPWTSFEQLNGGTALKSGSPGESPKMAPLRAM